MLYDIREYGYVRVSTKEQNTDRQYVAMLEAGIKKTRIFTDKQSGKDFDRRRYKKLVKMMKPKDVLFISTLDRLGRNYEEIKEQWRILTKEKGIDIVVMDMPLLDTRIKDGDLTRSFIADMVLQVLSYVAEVERQNIRKRQAEGIAVAKAKGKHLGRPEKKLADDFDKVSALWKDKKITLKEALKSLGCGRTYFFDRLRKEQNADLLQNNVNIL